MRRKSNTKTEFIIACVLVAVVLFAIWFALRLVAWGQCSWYGYETSRTTRYSPFIGCMIQTPAGWIPRAELRIVQ